MRLEQPLGIEAPFGSASLGGRIGLDGRVDLRGTVQIAPELLAQMSSGRLKPQAPLALPIGIGGTLEQPAVTVSVNPVDIARTLLGAPQIPLP
jgi:AsmA protein